MEVVQIISLEPTLVRIEEEIGGFVVSQFNEEITTNYERAGAPKGGVSAPPYRRSWNIVECRGGADHLTAVHCESHGRAHRRCSGARASSCDVQDGVPPPSLEADRAKGSKSA